MRKNHDPLNTQDFYHKFYICVELNIMCWKLGITQDQGFRLESITYNGILLTKWYLEHD